ncbi:hypothetical protein IPF37_04750 [bacterium]|nr:MAG: hypothetical protein IPF37_04750 [bacterium]
MKFMSKVTVFALAVVLGGNMLSAAGLPKGKELLVEDGQLSEVFNDLGGVPVSDSSAASLATRYGHALQAYYGGANDATRAAIFDQIRSFIRTAMIKCIKNWEEVKGAIELYIIDNNDVPFDESLRGQLKNDLDQIVQEKELSWIDEEFKPELQKCSEFFLSEQAKDASPASRKIMIKKLEKLIKRGGRVFEKAVKDGKISAIDFDENFAAPVHDIVVKIDSDKVLYSEKIREAIEQKFQESTDWYFEKKEQEQPESSWKQYVGPVLTGMMLTAGGIAAYNQMNSASTSNTNVAASGLEVADQAVPAGDQTTNTSVSRADVADVDVVHQPSVAAPQVIVSAPDAVDLMRAGTTTPTKAELPVGQSYGPRPTLSESVKDMFMGNTPAFYDPVQHSGFDIKKVQETQQAEENIADEKRQAEYKQELAEQRAMKILKPEEIEVLTAKIRVREQLPDNAEITGLERDLDTRGKPMDHVSGRATYVDQNGCTITTEVGIPIGEQSASADTIAMQNQIQEQSIKLRDSAIAKFEKANPSVKRFEVRVNMSSHSQGADGEWVHDPYVSFQWKEEWAPEPHLRRLLHKMEFIRVSPQEIANAGSSSWWALW